MVGCGGLWWGVAWFGGVWWGVAWFGGVWWENLSFKYQRFSIFKIEKNN